MHAAVRARYTSELNFILSLSLLIYCPPVHNNSNNNNNNYKEQAEETPQNQQHHHPTPLEHLRLSKERARTYHSL